MTSITLLDQGGGRARGRGRDRGQGKGERGRGRKGGRGRGRGGERRVGERRVGVDARKSSEGGGIEGRGGSEGDIQHWQQRQHGDPHAYCPSYTYSGRPSPSRLLACKGRRGVEREWWTKKGVGESEGKGGERIAWNGIGWRDGETEQGMGWELGRGNGCATVEVVHMLVGGGDTSQ